MVYKQSDFETLEFHTAITNATIMWRERCEAYYNHHGDVGSCVIGAGIEVDFMAPHCKKVSQKMIISVSHVSPTQGSCVWEDSITDIIAYLRERGIDAHYNPGRMD